jgi:hypothetical protein
LNWCFGRVSTAVSVIIHAPNWHVVWVDFADLFVAGNPGECFCIKLELSSGIENKIHGFEDQ